MSEFYVYFCGDVLPTCKFDTREEAEEFLKKFEGDEFRWMDKEITENPTRE